MSNRPPNHLQSLWKSQAIEPRRRTSAELRDGALRFQRTIHRRNMREYIAGVVVAGIFGTYLAFSSRWSERAGHALVLAGTATVMLRLRTQAAASAKYSEETSESCLVFYRRDLERQRDALRGAWRWYLGPLLPGILLLLSDLFLHVIADSRQLFVGGALTAGSGLFFLGVIWWNNAAAKRLQRELEVLAAEGEEVSSAKPH